MPSLRALLVVTFRPEFAAPWVGRAHVASLQLSRFGRRNALTMVERVAGGKALPAEVLEQIIAKTDGVPLFVEELTRTVLEQKRDEIAADLKITEDAVEGFFQTLGEQNVPSERLTTKLIEIASQFEAARRRLAALDPDDPATKTLVDQAQVELSKAA